MMTTADGEKITRAEFTRRQWAAEKAAREFDRAVGETGKADIDHPSIDLLRCSPEAFVDGLKGRSVAELYDLEKELGERHRVKRAMLVNAYLQVKRDFEGVP